MPSELIERARSSRQRCGIFNLVRGRAQMKTEASGIKGAHLMQGQQKRIKGALDGELAIGDCRSVHDCSHGLRDVGISIVSEEV